MRWISELFCLNNECIKSTKNVRRERANVIKHKYCRNPIALFLSSESYSYFISPNIILIREAERDIVQFVEMQRWVGDPCCAVDLFLSTPVFSLHWTQSGRKCVIVASAMRAEQGPSEPIKGCICEIREQ